MITFNVIFVPGSVELLLPFALSLLQSSQVRVRVVANGCRPEEVASMRAATRIDERFSFHALPHAAPIEHGYVLNELFERFDEPFFAFADSDVIASGDFMRGLEPIPSGTAVFSAPPVWMVDDEMVVPSGARMLAGRWRVLADGTPIGSSYLAIYERAAIAPVLRQAPRGFAVHYRRMLPASIRNEFSNRGWDFDQYDSGRVVNLLLVIEGHRLENRDIPELHHIGGFSVSRRPSPVRDLIGRIRSRNGPTLRQTLGGVAFRGYRRLRRHEPDWAAKEERRRIVLEYAGAALDAIRDGREPPPAPQTASRQLNERVAGLRSALREQYGPALSAVRRAQRGGESPET